VIAHPDGTEAHHIVDGSGTGWYKHLDGTITYLEIRFDLPKQ
jgi:hypothetical protein